MLTRLWPGSSKVVNWLWQPCLPRVGNLELKLFQGGYMVVTTLWQHCCYNLVISTSLLQPGYNVLPVLHAEFFWFHKIIIFSDKWNVMMDTSEMARWIYIERESTQIRIKQLIIIFSDKWNFMMDIGEMAGWIYIKRESTQIRTKQLRLLSVHYPSFQFLRGLVFLR